MPKIENHTDKPITAPSGHIVPAEGSLSVSDVTMQRLANEPVIAKHLRRADLTVVADDPGPESPEITRAYVAKATRSDLIDLIIANSEYTESDLEGVKVEDSDDEQGLRSLAAGLMFGD